MCGRAEDLTRAIDAAVKAAAAPSPRAVNTAEAGQTRRRIALWEQNDSVHCSLLGTCASVGDLRRIARKVGIDIARGTPDYDIHGHFVRLATMDTPFTRAFQKLLDQRFEGALRRVARTPCAQDLNALWQLMCERGQVAPAYWAFMTHSHVPSDLRVRIFGEVHMLSHLAGASFRQKSVEAVALRDQLQEEEDRARRVEAGLKQALEARDRELADLRATLARLKADQAAPAPVEPRGASRDLTRRLDKMERALQSARVRARQAEARATELETASARRATASRPQTSASATTLPSVVALQPSGARPERAVLYIGGLHGRTERLRGIAQAFNASFHHHDGGVEDTPQRLDGMLPSVDCVLCPVNCVSHDACLRAKRMCQKLNKPFVPLRSSGQTAFRNALAALLRDEAAAPAHPDEPEAG
ncbi:DUF2325 domain-containing protein [Stappia taiwanensis]|uniref:DUF2325 domain-containing protein n=1 Tax=Stappia taiwanensis TaxID=992267 RepID=A0A838XQ11_9HYPH|nr:DUF2325 domain-containing protein [Stappia taiwanensis]MBA4612565.1 DUF2325 domain-containing protein [Stappia taiwanensis]GGE89481.1 hypothetical protein GCM10007285_16170 [Stappia taiwanensis]